MNSSKAGSPIKDWLANETWVNEIPEYSENKSQASCHVSEDSRHIQVKDSKGIKMDQESKISFKEGLFLKNEEIFSDLKNEAKTSIAKSLCEKENELQKETLILEPPTTVFDVEMLKVDETLIPEKKIALINTGSEPVNETIDSEVPECSENKSQDPCHISEDAHSISVKDSGDTTKINQKSKITCKDILPLEKEEIFLDSEKETEATCHILEDAHGIPVKDSEDMTEMNQKSKITFKDFLPLQKEEIFSDSEKEREATIIQALNTRENELQMEATMPRLSITSEIKILEIAKKLISEGKMFLINRLLESEDGVLEHYEHKSKNSCHASEDSNRTPVKDFEGMKVNYESTIACKEFLSFGNEDFKNETEATSVKPVNTEKNYLQTKSTALELPTTSTTFNKEVLEMAKMLKMSEENISLINRLLEVNDAAETTKPKARTTADEAKLLSAKRKDSQYLPEECNFFKRDTEEAMKESDECGRLPFVLGSLVIGHIKASTTDNAKSFASSKLEIPEPASDENCQASKLETDDKEQTNEHVEKNDAKFPSKVRSSAESKRKKKKKKNKNRKK